MQIQDPNQLKAYLTKELTCLSDADPEILSDYIIALLKHDKADLEESCISQLRDFLHENTKPFVERLFRYLKGGAVNPPRRQERSPPRNRSRSPERHDSHRSNRGRDEDVIMRDAPRDHARDMRESRDHRDSGKTRRSIPNRPESAPQKSTRLVADRIPSESCKISTVHDYFSKFGTLVNVTVHQDSGRAMIQYSTPEEAQKAYRCPDVIFNNRFVRLFWERTEDMYEERHGKKKIVFPKVNTYTAPNFQLPQRSVPPPSSAPNFLNKQLLALNKQKQGLLEEYLQQQKVLLVQLEENTEFSEEAKQEVLTALRTLDEKIKSIELLPSELPLSPSPTAPVQTKQTQISHRLDLRTTTFSIKPIPQKLEGPDTEPARILLSSFGTVKDLKFVDECLLVSFQSRLEAEKAMKYLPLASLGDIELTWM